VTNAIASLATSKCILVEREPTIAGLASKKKLLYVWCAPQLQPYLTVQTARANIATHVSKSFTTWVGREDIRKRLSKKRLSIIRVTALFAIAEQEKNVHMRSAIKWYVSLVLSSNTKTSVLSTKRPKLQTEVAPLRRIVRALEVRRPTLLF
jgi:hypothetical protein